MTAVIIILLAGGMFFFLVGVAGLLRLPDVFCRMHATTKCDTLGAGLILLALALYAGFSATAVKLLLLIVLVWIANPTAAHVIARAAYLKKVKTAPGTVVLDKRGEVGAHD
ncbi:MAG TPA: monovalent cation/H(+) antiporter subunit G [Firmicutes bacterium]|nr:monovalent cation/H(+) antiporter subunit G [Bacillota bacterium]